MKMVEQIIQDIERQGWSVVPGVVPTELLQKAREVVEQMTFVPAKVGGHSQRERHEGIRGDSIAWIDPLTPPEELRNMIHFLETLKGELNRRFYLGLKEFECHLAKYPVGSFYKKHLDRFQNDSSRSFSFIFYLHESWSEGDGGELVLYDKEGNVLQVIRPLPGTFVGFLSEDFPHEVKVAHKTRLSLTGWMHTKIIN